MRAQNQNKQATNQTLVNQFRGTKMLHLTAGHRFLRIMMHLPSQKLELFLLKRFCCLSLILKISHFLLLFQIWIHCIIIFNFNLISQALELRKVQTPLYEEFYNNLNAPSSPSFGGSSRDETPPNYLILPPKSRSPNQIPVGSPSTSTDAVSTGSHGSNKRASNFGNASNQASEDNSYPRSNDRKGLLLDDQPETFSPRLAHRLHP